MISHVMVCEVLVRVMGEEREAEAGVPELLHKVVNQRRIEPYSNKEGSADRVNKNK
jgi:hypothetical protein